MQCEVTGFESKAYQAVSRMYASATIALSLRFHSIPLIVYGSTYVIKYIDWKLTVDAKFKRTILVVPNRTHRLCTRAVCTLTLTRISCSRRNLLHLQECRKNEILLSNLKGHRGWLARQQLANVPCTIVLFSLRILY